MLSQKKIKLIQSLQLKKFRQKYNLFVVEGKKLTKDILNSNFKVEEVFSTHPIAHTSATIISETDLKKISSLKNPQGILALVSIPQTSSIIPNINTIVLEEIQDPGNLGTIIRTADWFGISQLICTQNSVDVFNPKVVQATMGSLTRVNVFYQPIESVLSEFKGTVVAADMSGTNIYNTAISSPFALIMGNEGKGLSEFCKQNANLVSIPAFNSQTESLNVSTAQSILLSEIMRKNS